MPWVYYFMMMKQEEMFCGVPDGIADCGWYTVSKGGTMPLNEYSRMPLMSKSYAQQDKIIRAM